MLKLNSHAIQISSRIHNFFFKIFSSELFKNLFFYSFGNIILRAIPFIFTPFTLMILQPNDYGLLSLLHSFISFIAIFSGLGLRQAILIEFFHKNTLDQKKMINTVIAMYCVLAIPFLILIGFNFSSINKYIFLGASNLRLILLCLSSCILYFFSELFYQILMYKGLAFQLTIIQIFITLVTTILNFILIYSFHLGVPGMMIAYLINQLIACLIGLYYYLKKAYYHYFDLFYIKMNGTALLKTGIPFIPSMLLGWILSSSDRWILAQYSSLNDVGIYALADTFGQIYQVLVIFPLNNAYLPYLLKKFADNNNSISSVEDWNRRNMYLTMFSMLFIIMLGSCFGKFILYWILPSKYHETIQYISLILLGYIFWTGTYFTLGLILYFKKTYFHAFSLAIPSLLNIILNYLLTPSFKIYGCIIATLLSYAIYFLVTLAYNYFLQINFYNNKKGEVLS